MEMETPMRITTKVLATALLTTSLMHSTANATSTSDRVVRWHEIMLQTEAIDFTPIGGNPAALEQLGPVRTARAFAITQIAVFDAMNAIVGGYKPYNDLGTAPGGASVDAAIACAAHDALVALFPSQSSDIDALLAADLASIAGGQQELDDGCAVGQESAAVMLARRTNDGSELADPDFGTGGRVATGVTNWFGEGVNDGTDLTFRWNPDPVSNDALALGGNWGAVTPFVLDRGNQFRAPAPPIVGQREYVGAWNQVARIGGSPFNTGIPSSSTPGGRFIGNFWGYDAVPLLGTPPRLYAQIAIQVALEQGLTDPLELARYLALIHVGLGDAGISAWDSKYFYNYWRPVSAIREDDGVANTPSDASWEPVGVSVANTPDAIRPTPPFPAYPSGHATFGATTFMTMAAFFGNNTSFTFVSDEYDGVTSDPFTPGVPRPLVPVRYRRLSQAAEENGFSRVLNGVHWQFDNIAGQRMGGKISNWIMNSVDAFQPVDN